MNDKNGHSATEPNAPQPDWPDPPFDAATNFSLLGWILDKILPGRKSEKKVDFR